MIEKIKNIQISFDYGKLALFFSLIAMAFVGMSQNTPCAYAQAGACSVGEDIIATGNIGIKGGTSDTATLDASGITSDITLTIPNTSGTIALTTGALSINKVMATDGSGDPDTTDVYPLTLSASKSISTDVSGNLETNDVYPLTLTADKLLVSDGSGNLTTSDLVPMSFTASSVVLTDVSGNLTDGTVDLNQLTPGGASTDDEIRMGAGGDWESYTPAPAAGGRWTLVASVESHETATAMSTYESAGDSVQICWGGASSTDGTDGNYFRMTDGKRYKLVFAPNNSISSSMISSNGYNAMGISYIGSSVDCVNGANPQSYTTSAGYSFSSTDWFYYWNKNIYNTGASYNNNTWNCNVLNYETIQVDYGIQNWSGEIDLWDINTDWNGSDNQVVANWDIMFGVKDFNSPYDLKDPARSSGTCASVGTTSGGDVSKMSDMYGFYFNNFRPSGTGGDGILYWLYESNDFDNRP